MTLQFSAALLLIIACWAIGPALICERRLRAFDAGHGWGLVIGGVLGPLGVAAINIYISLQSWSLRPRTNRGQRRPHLAAHWYGEGRRVSMRGDIIALACLWVAILLGSALLTVDNLEAQVVTHTAGHSQSSFMPTQGISATAPQQAAGTASPPGAEGLSLQALNQTTRPDKIATGSGELMRLSAGREAAPLPTAGGERAADSAPTALPEQPNSNTTAQSAGTGAVPTIAAVVPPAKPIAARASAGELMRLVVASNLKAHGTISGAGNGTTLMIACADCTHQMVAVRLRAGGVRATIKSAGVHVVVLLNGQDSWTFML